MSENIVVIGGVAAGMSAASQARRRKRGAEVIVLERGRAVSYGACGMPYNIESSERSIDDLVVISAERFRSERNIDVRTQHEVRAVNTAEKLLRVYDGVEAREYDQPYDKLVIATGANAVRPPLPGLDLPGVFVLRQLSDGAAIKQHLAEHAPKRAVIIGAGYIGMEMAEALATRGLEVTVLEKLPAILPGYDPAIVEVAEAKLEAEGIEVKHGANVTSVEKKAEGTLLVVSDDGAYEADLVLVSVGVRPNVGIAEQAGIALGSTGAIAVDDQMRTSLDDVFAAGDCAEAHHLVLNAPSYVPLGTTANKQGKVAGANAAGGNERFGGIVGTAGFKLFDLEVARTGLGPVELDRQGLSAIRAASTHGNRGHGFPGRGKITTVLFLEPGSGKLLGAQMIGPGAVAVRIDVFAAALHAGMTAEQIEALDLAYAPPFAPVYDPILIAASVGRKQLESHAAE